MKNSIFPTECSGVHINLTSWFSKAKILKTLHTDNDTTDNESFYYSRRMDLVTCWCIARSIWWCLFSSCNSEQERYPVLGIYSWLFTMAYIKTKHTSTCKDWWYSPKVPRWSEIVQTNVLFFPRSWGIMMCTNISQVDKVLWVSDYVLDCFQHKTIWQSESWLKQLTHLLARQNQSALRNLLLK